MKYLINVPIITILLFPISNIFAQSLLINNFISYKDSLWQKTVYNYNSDKTICNKTVFKSTDKKNWNNHTYCTYNYTNGAVSEICDYLWNDTTWITNKTQLFEYNENRLSSHITEYKKIKEISTYDYQDNCIIETHKIFEDGVFKYIHATIKYINNNQISKIKTYSLSVDNDTLFSQITFFEEDHKKLVTTTHEKIGSEYHPSQKTITTYTNNTDIEIQYKYSQNKWIPTSKRTSYYDDSKLLIKELYQIWENNFWLSDYQKKYTYDDKKTLSTISNFILQYKEWELLYQINYNYLNQLDNAYIEQSFWSNNNREYNDYIAIYGNNKPPYAYCNQIEFEYSNISTDISISISPIEIYPNPTKSGIVFINSQVPILQVSIFDINGILLYSDQYSRSINLSHLKNGLYIIHITTEDRIYTFKQIIANY